MGTGEITKNFQVHSRKMNGFSIVALFFPGGYFLADLNVGTYFSAKSLDSNVGRKFFVVFLFLSHLALIFKFWSFSLDAIGIYGFLSLVSSYLWVKPQTAIRIEPTPEAQPEFIPRSPPEESKPPAVSSADPAPSIDLETQVAILDGHFTQFFHKNSSESWNALIRYATDGGANSVLASYVLKKTSLQMRLASEHVKNMMDAVDKVQGAMGRLDSISKGIVDLSNQSRIVSINAFLEAERAGEHGKVFRVIAGELGRLAQDTKLMTSQTDEVLKHIQESAHYNRKLCQEVARVFIDVDLELKEFSKIMMRIEELSSIQTKNFETFEKNMKRVLKSENLTRIAA